MILADPVEIHQVVMNLCTNSLHSMRDKGGVLQVSLSDIEIKSDNTPQTLNILPGHYIMLKVADTGYGMSQEILERIFEPYFTTKPKGEGTGLGLATVHGIVEDINGNISVKSEVGRGTTFTLYFPGIEHDVDKDGKKASSGLIPGGNEHILLVDDEKQICELMCKMLESLGYHVTPHISGIEALADLKNRPHEFDMLLTDMTMPKMTGLQLIMQIKMIRLDIPVIIFTGFSESIDRKKAHALGVHEFVMKPVVRSDIAGAIRRALAAPEKE